MLIYQLEIISACMETIWKYETSLLVAVVIINLAHLLELLLVDINHNSTRTGFKVHTGCM